MGIWRALEALPHGGARNNPTTLSSSCNHCHNNFTSSGLVRSSRIIWAMALLHRRWSTPKRPAKPRALSDAVTRPVTVPAKTSMTRHLVSEAPLAASSAMRSVCQDLFCVSVLPRGAVRSNPFCSTSASPLGTQLHAAPFSRSKDAARAGQCSRCRDLEVALARC